MTGPGWSCYLTARPQPKVRELKPRQRGRQITVAVCDTRWDDYGSLVLPWFKEKHRIRLKYAE